MGPTCAMDRERSREDEIPRILQRVRDGNQGLEGQCMKGTMDGRVVAQRESALSICAGC